MDLSVRRAVLWGMMAKLARARDGVGEALIDPSG
jgi:hypothetical protein